jgi:hypothetical protein
MSKPDLCWQRDTALRQIEKLKAELNGQPASDQFLADKAARYVGTTAANVLAWMKGRP